MTLHKDRGANPSDPGLGADELTDETATELPDREAMSLIKPGLGLIEGNLVEPQAPSDLSGLGGGTPSDATLPPSTTESYPTPTDIEPAPTETSEPQPYSPVASETTTS